MSGPKSVPSKPQPLNAQEHYVTTVPDPQNALDIFHGEWASKLPTPFQQLNAGPLPLFEDPRIAWFVDRLGGIAGKSVLELGPLEGGHSYMLERAGASSVVAIEANTRAFLKCLVVKEILRLERVQFSCGDFIEYLRNSPSKFNICLASGVLYHMTNPVELLSLLARTADHICLWTQYYDEKLLSNRSHIAKQFTDHLPAEFEGFKHTKHRQFYNQEGIGSLSFCGGNQPSSTWLSRDDILGAFRHFGFANIEVGFDTPDHPNGPAFSLIATRS